MEDWIDSPVSSSVPAPVVRAKKTKKRRHRPAPVPFVNIVEVPASSVITVNAVVPAGSVPASVEGEVCCLALTPLLLFQMLIHRYTSSSTRHCPLALLPTVLIAVRCLGRFLSVQIGQSTANGLILPSTK